MEITYGKWFRSKKKIIQKESAEEARRRHDSREPYNAVFGDPSAPDAFLEVNDSFVYIGYLDDLQREHQGYEFEETQPGTLFLREVQLWQYEGDSDERTHTTRYRFAPDGSAAVQTIERRTANPETIELDDPVDVSDYYTSYPDFGSYDHLFWDLDRVDLSPFPVQPERNQ